MYLTDYRERSLRDVITQLEPRLFKKVTGLDVKDFELLCSLGVFNASLMNDAIFKFKRYEDSSLSYTGIDKHQGEDIGGWDTVIRRRKKSPSLCRMSMRATPLCIKFSEAERSHGLTKRENISACALPPGKRRSFSRMPSKRAF